MEVTPKVKEAMTNIENGPIDVDVSIGVEIGAGDGHISAAGFEAQDAQELAETIAQKYLVRVRPNAPGVCIDGRGCKCTMRGPESKPEPGPSLAGGTLLTAFGAAEMLEGYYGTKSANTSLGRLSEVKESLDAAGVAMGGHVTEAAAQKNFLNDKNEVETGCGLNDKFKKVMAQMNGPHASLIRDTTEALLDNESFAAKARSGDDITDRVADYDAKSGLEILVGKKGENEDAVEVLTGNHGELMVMFNYVKGTTIDRDALVAETGKQVFAVDMWYIEELAEKMAAGRPDATDMKTQLQHAMVAFQLATYLTLCDGTHRPGLLKENMRLAA